jgi:hypothetical protein
MLLDRAGVTAKLTLLACMSPRLTRVVEGFAEVCVKPDGTTTRTV